MSIRYKKGLRHHAKIFFVSTLAVVGYHYLFYAALQALLFKGYVSEMASNYLEQRLQTTVEIEMIGLNPLEGLFIKKLYLEDKQQDTLLYFDRLSVFPSNIRISQNVFEFGKINLNGLVAHIKEDSIEGNNYDFIVEAFSSADTTPTDSEQTILNFANISVDATRIEYVQNNPTPVAKLNFEHLKLRNFDFTAQNLTVINDSISGKISRLALTDHSGFRIEQLSTNWMTVSPTAVDLNKLVIQTNQTNLSSNFVILHTQSWKSYNQFSTDVKINASFNDQSYFSLHDLNYFSSGADNIDERIWLSGRILGYINNLKGTDLKLGISPRTYIKSNFNVKGLPSITNTYLNLDIEKLKLVPNELMAIKDANTSKPLFVLPQEVLNLKNISYEGKISGLLNNLLLNGTLNTSIGTVHTDVRVQTNSEQKYYWAEGLINFINLNAGAIIGDTANLQQLNLENDFQLKYYFNNQFEGQANARIQSIDYNKYVYKNIEIKGDFTNSSFYGNLKINDPNLDLSFIGGFDLSGEIPTFSFSSNLAKANLYALNLATKDSITQLSVMLNANFKGKKFNDLDGTITLFLNNIELQKKQLSNAQITLSATPLDNERKRVKLNSEFVEATIEGKFDYETFAYSLEQFAYRYAPSLTDTLETIPENDFHLKLTTKNITPLSFVFFPDYWIAPQSTLDVQFSSQNEKMVVDFTASNIKYTNYEINNLWVKSTNNKQNLSIDANASDFIFGDGNYLKNILITNNLHKDTVLSNIQWNNNKMMDNYSADLLSEIIFSRSANHKSYLTTIKLLPSTTIIGDIPWYNDVAEIQIDSSATDIRNLKFKNRNQAIHINGIISENKTDTLELNFVDFSMESLNPLTEANGMVLGGLMNGSVKATNLLTQPFILIEDSVKSLIMNEQEIGDLLLTSRLIDANKLKINAITKRGKINTLDIDGFYNIDTDQIKLTAKLNKLYLSIIEPYLNGIVSDIYNRSSVTGDARIFGKLSNPQYMINLKLSRMAFTVDYLQTRYNFTHNIFISNKLVKIQKMKINAGPNSFATLDGTIRHNNFDNMQLNFDMEAQNFHLLNTMQTDTSYFFGTAFATGNFSVTGTPDDIKVDISAKTNKNTRFFIPLSSSSEVSSSNSFLTFEKPKIQTADSLLNFGEETENNTEEYQVDLSGVQLNFNLDITPEAEVQLIFDETVGDIIKASGTGNLKLGINTNGDFNMYGTYFIEKGDYLFTLQNVINKHFFVQPGGSIRWTGDPYNAQLNLNAIYKIKRVDLYDLLQDPEYKEQKTQVECQLAMSKNLMSPGIDMAIALPTADERIAAQVNSLGEDDKNKQILSLLILNRFQPLPGISAVSSDQGTSESGQSLVSSNATEVLSNQLSHWLSQISEKVDIGVNYQLGNELTKDELEVALSTQLFNDRVSVNSNVGVGGGKVNEPTTTANTTNASNIVGDVDVEVKLDKKGNVRLKAFAKANDQENIMYQQTPYEQGIGVFYRKDFNTFSQLLTDIWNTISFKEKRNAAKKKEQEKQNKKTEQNKAIERREE